MLSLSLRLKLTIFGVITILFSLLIGYLVVTPLLINIETNQYIDEVRGQYDIYQNNIEHFRTDLAYSILLFQQTNEIYTDSSDFTNYLTAFDDGFTFDPPPSEEDIIVSMYDYALINRNVESIYIGYEDTGAFVRTAPIQDTHPAGEGFNYDPRDRLWYTSAVANDGDVVFNDIEQHPTNETYFSTLSTTLYDFGNNFVGVVGIDINLDSYMENFTQVDNLSRGQFIYTQGNKAVLINEDDSIEILPLNDVYEGLDFVEEINVFDTKEVELEGTNYVAIVSPVEGTSIRLVHLITDAGIRNIIMAKVTNIRTLFIGITLLLILAMLVVQEFIVLKPLGEIQQEIKDYKQSNITSHFRFLEEGSKEFVQISGVLNEMVDTINQNMDTMTERINEMNCLYQVTYLAYKENKIDAILDGTAKAIVQAMKYPEDARVHIRYKDKDFYSQVFETTPWKLSVDLESQNGIVGCISVYYINEKPDEDIGPFETEEQQLLESIATTLIIALTYRQ
ncbi:PDC sensor domain-containing protein [Candidatus Xianfuyuplasma coldseepsis]|uniref:Cache domain-containing protein n=1 Tax=Candidatus Xianfuyuplasma coldseepsis TaxID=2782163 RepID=A0A7L7KRW4_9MOLU|nr:PDC sensor domain-containing protein [Xianfuyuplasma coldseepsis]QMS84694.1 hypothetical protein G4Z02_02645 [Xianfuyuplasma coldseepsis]